MTQQCRFRARAAHPFQMDCRAHELLATIVCHGSLRISGSLRMSVGIALKAWENNGYIKLISSSMLRERCPKIRKAPALSEDRGGSRTTEAPTGGRAARPAAPPPASTRTALCAHSTVCAQHCVRPGWHAPGRPSGLRTQASHDPCCRSNNDSSGVLAVSNDCWRIGLIVGKLGMEKLFEVK